MSGHWCPSAECAARNHAAAEKYFMEKLIADGWRPPIQWDKPPVEVDLDAQPEDDERDDDQEIGPDCDSCFGQGCTWCCARQIHDQCYCSCTPRPTDDEGRLGLATGPDAWPA